MEKYLYNIEVRDEWHDRSNCFHTKSFNSEFYLKSDEDAKKFANYLNEREKNIVRKVTYTRTYRVQKSKIIIGNCDELIKLLNSDNSRELTANKNDRTL